MKIFLDTADLKEIESLVVTGLVDGVTTNPSLILKSGRDFKQVVREICALVSGPVSAEVIATDYTVMLEEARVLAAIAKNVCVKLPLTLDGVRACKDLAAKGISTNMTLCFSPTQALAVGKVGATFVSPFVGRLDDVQQDGIQLLQEIKTVYKHYGIKTQILAASIRTVNHVKQAALVGVDAVTIPPAVLRALLRHPQTDSGLQTFLADWAQTKQVITS